MQLSGKTYALRFDMLCFKRFKEKTGQDILSGLGNLGTDEIVTLAWAAIRSAEKAEGKESDLTVDDVAGLMELNDLKAFTEEVKKIFPGSETSGEGKAGE